MEEILVQVSSNIGATSVRGLRLERIGLMNALDHFGEHKLQQVAEEQSVSALKSLTLLGGTHRVQWQ